MNLDFSKIKAPFTVPEGYFDRMEDRLLTEIKISNLKDISKETVPVTYFDTLESQILTRINLEKQVKQEAAPHRYFETLEEQILSRVNIENLQNERVEEGYFNQLEKQILAQTKLEELAQPAVAASYFEDLEAAILEKTILVKKPKFRIFRNVKVLRNIAAILVLGAGIYGVTQYETKPKDQFATVSSDAMIAYLAEQPITPEDLSFVLDKDDVYLTSELSNSDIEKYLKENGL